MTAIGMDPRLRARRVEVLRLQGRRRLRVLLALGGVAALAAGVVAVVRSPLFDVDTIRVTGATNTTSAEVLEAAAVPKGKPLLELDTSAVEQAVAELPWIDSVSTSRAFDGTLAIDVVERQAAAAVIGVDSWLIVDPDGRVLAAVDALPADTVVIEGATWNAAPGDWISERALPAIELASSMPATLREAVASVQFDTAGDRLGLLLYGGGSIVIGDLADIEAKYLAAISMLGQADLTCLERIDVRAPSVPVLTRRPDCS